MNTETNDKYINVEKIMEEIREKVKQKKEQGIYNDEEDQKVSEMELSPFENGQAYGDDVEYYQSILNRLRDPREDFTIKSHRKKLGYFIIFTKKTIRKILKLLSIPNLLLSRQAEFNLQLLVLLTSLRDQHKSEKEEMSTKLKEITDKILEATNRMMEIRQENILQKHRLTRILQELREKYDLPEEGIAKLVQERDNLQDHNYFLFENRYRGEQEEIKKRQEIYLPVFKNADNVLDIGCGRGEFLELLQKEDVKAAGIDLNEDMIYLCKEKKLDAKQVDAMTYLTSLKDGSLGGIFVSHVIEHLTNSRLLIEFIQLCYSKLKEGSHIILETPNPLSMTVSAVNFYLDPSHVMHIHPHTIKFLLETNGFHDIQLKYLSPFPSDMTLHHIDYNQPLEDSENMPYKLLNDNFKKLNNMLFGYQDFAAIGKK